MSAKRISLLVFFLMLLMPTVFGAKPEYVKADQDEFVTHAVDVNSIRFIRVNDLPDASRYTAKVMAVYSDSGRTKFLEKLRLKNPEAADKLHNLLLIIQDWELTAKSNELAKLLGYIAVDHDGKVILEQVVQRPEFSAYPPGSAGNKCIALIHNYIHQNYNLVLQRE